jgi:tRNA threonylcarbamoyladenosine biosynthesis protein TsaB
VVRSGSYVGDHCAPRIRAVPGSRALGLVCQRLRLFRPWAEYIIGYRQVKLVQSARDWCNWWSLLRLIKHSVKLTEPIILALDTSSKTTSISVANGGRILKSVWEPSDEKRSDTLWAQVRALLAELGMTIGGIDVFSVCIGPGGFTGLRVGMAAAMGFSDATEKALVGVTSLEATAFAAGDGVPVCALVNAYKGEVYSQLFSFDADGAPIARNDPMISSVGKALDRVVGESDLVFAGDGAQVGAEAIGSASGARAELKWTTYRSNHGLAEEVARLAFLKYERNEMESAGVLKACYVRKPEAEIKLSLGLLGSKIKRSMKPE